MSDWVLPRGPNGMAATIKNLNSNYEIRAELSKSAELSVPKDFESTMRIRTSGVASHISISELTVL